MPRMLAIDERTVEELTGVLSRLKSEGPAKRATRSAAASFTCERMALAVLVESKWAGHRLTKAEIARRAGCSVRHLDRSFTFTKEWKEYRDRFRAIKAGKFPRPISKTIAFFPDDKTAERQESFDDLDHAQREELRATAERMGPPGRDVLILIAGLNGEPPMSLEQAATRLGIPIRRAEKHVHDAADQWATTNA